MSVTFFLAMAGYVCLTAAAVGAVRQPPKFLIRVTAAIVLSHVLLVWSVHYDWSLTAATRNGYAGFVMFHAALAAIVGAMAAPEPLARRLIVAAFAIVSVGALGAVFRYDVVRIYRVPVIVCAAAGGIGVVRAARRAATAPQTHLEGT
jgi:hypothetical protein